MRHRVGVPLAILAAVASAAAATVVLRPGERPVEAPAVEETAYFSPQQLSRAQRFRDPQRAIGLLSLGASGATLVLLVLRPPGPVRRGLDRAAARPLLGGAAAGAGLSLALTAVGLPFDAVAHQRAVDVGLSNQTWGPWLGDVARSTALGAAFAGLGGLGALALIRRAPRRWWLPGSALVVGISATFLFVSPVVLDPIFNRFEPLPAGELRRDVLTLAERAGVDVGEVLRVDASRRTPGANAWVGGLGQTKRVVLYDNLIEDFPPAEVRSVVAHELGHVTYRDLPRGLLWLAFVTPAATFLVQRLAERLRQREAGELGVPAALPALALAFALVSFGVTSVSNVQSRAVEARADAFALRLTDDPDAFIALARRLVVQNVADPSPPRLTHLLFGTHPTPITRIGYGVAWEGARAER